MSARVETAERNGIFDLLRTHAGGIAPLLEYIPFIALGVLFVVASIASSSFLNVHNLLNVAQASAVLGFVTLGTAIVLLSGCLDLSVGAVMAAGAMACFGAEREGAAVAIAAGLAVGIGIGAINGFLVGLIGANALIVTLGVASVVSGGLLVLSNARFMTGNSGALQALGQDSVLGVPVSVVVFAVVLVALTWWMRRVTSGRVVLAAGANPRASFASGLAVPRIRFYCFVLSGLLAAVAGIVLAGRVNSAYSSMGAVYTFQAITAAVLGGVSLFGGIGSLIRATVGVVVLALLNNVMNLLSLPIESQLIAQGVLFIAIIALDGLARSQGQR